jgi:hypothetical protein
MSARYKKSERRFSMKKVVSLALLAGGSRLTIFGVSAYALARSDISRRLPVSPTNKAKLMLIGGVVVTVIGLVGLLCSSKAS